MHWKEGVYHHFSFRKTWQNSQTTEDDFPVYETQDLETNECLFFLILKGFQLILLRANILVL